MKHHEPAPPRLSNHEWLVERCAERLLSYRPSSLLDVGCGSGALLRTFVRAGVECTGLDRPGPRLAALREEGLAVREGSAYELPFATEAVEWVTMRHIPHHLEDPARAFREAQRVAVRGVLIAEPWFDVTLTSQAAALRYDRFEKSLDRRDGQYHAESMTLNDLLNALPKNTSQDWEVLASTDLRLRARDIEEALESLSGRVARLPGEDSLHSEYAELEARVRRDGLSFNGSLCVILVKR